MGLLSLKSIIGSSNENNLIIIMKKRGIWLALAVSISSFHIGRQISKKATLREHSAYPLNQYLNTSKTQLMIQFFSSHSLTLWFLFVRFSVPSLAISVYLCV